MFQEKKLSIVKQIVSSDRNMTEETRDKLVSISSVESFARHDLESPGDPLADTTSEIESSTRSILSSLDITSEKTDEDIELSAVRSARDIRTRPSTDFLAVPEFNQRPKFSGKRFHEVNYHFLSDVCYFFFFLFFFYRCSKLLTIQCCLPPLEFFFYRFITFFWDSFIFIGIHSFKIFETRWNIFPLLSFFLFSISLVLFWFYRNKFWVLKKEGSIWNSFNSQWFHYIFNSEYFVLFFKN